jgi:hypothetical protein
MGQWGQLEALGLLLYKYSEAGEGTEDAIEGARVCPNSLSQLRAVFWPVAEEIGNPELGHHIEQLCEAIAIDHTP